MSKRTESTMICNALTIPHRYCKALAKIKLTKKLPAMMAVTALANPSLKVFSVSGVMKLGLSNVGIDICARLRGELAALPSFATNY